MKSSVLGLAFFLALAAPAAGAGESVVTVTADDGTRLSYLLTVQSAAPRYVILGFPGGSGLFNARVEDGEIRFAFGGNFVVRTRNLVVDDEFAMALTDATSVVERMAPIVADLHRRFPAARIYLISTSNGTIDSANLSLTLGGIGGAIHTSSMARLAAVSFDKSTVRQLFVHHLNDGCRATSYGAAKYVTDKYHIKLITMTGGHGTGDPCEPFGYHGYADIEPETIAAIKQWVREDGAPR